jgi:ABC-type transporter MlaC component
VRTLVLSLLLVASAQAETATEALKARDAEIRAALPPKGTEPSPATRQKLESIVTQAVDLDAMAKSALGKTWTETPSGQAEEVPRGLQEPVPEGDWRAARPVPLHRDQVLPGEEGGR